MNYLHLCVSSQLMLEFKLLRGHFLLHFVAYRGIYFQNS
jgi:hypothetical protein